MKKQLRGNVALLFGATNKVSATTALLLAREGVHLALLDQSDERLHALVRSLRYRGIIVSKALVDLANPVTLPDSVKEALQPHGGRVDVLVNNLGRYPIVPPENPTWEDLFQIAFIGYLHVTMEVLPRMARQQGGTILHVVPDLTHCSSFHTMHLRIVEDSVLALAMGLADGFGFSGIRQAFLAPRPFLTRVWAHHNDVLGICARVSAWLPEDMMREINGYQGIVLPQLMQPEKVARLLIALLSPKDTVSISAPGERESNRIPLASD